LLSTHADRQGDDISITVCLFVFVFVCFFVCICTIRDFSAKDKASGIKFCTAVHWRLKQGITELASVRATPTCINITVEMHSSWNIARHVDVGSACVDIHQSPLTYLFGFSVSMIAKNLSLYLIQMIQVNRRRSGDHLVTSPADEAAASSAVNSKADASVEPQASSSKSLLPYQNDDEEETQDELTSDQLRPLRLELTPESQLDSTDPVCVDLLDCSAPVTDVLKWLTSATWYACVCQASVLAVVNISVLFSW